VISLIVFKKRFEDPVAIACGSSVRQARQ
jgi:hypothetical protein